MNTDNLSTKLRAKELRDMLRDEVGTVAATGLSMVIQRVSETGKDITGALFKPYTEEYERRKRFAVGTAKREGAARRAARRTASATASNPVGRFTGFPNFTLTGQMLSSVGVESGKPKYKNIGPTTVIEGGSFIVVRVTGRDEETRAKMEGNDNYRPGWFRLAPAEKDILVDQSATRYAKQIQAFLTQ